MNQITKILDEDTKKEIELSNENIENENENKTENIEKKHTNFFSIFILVLITIFLLVLTIFTIYNMFNENIIHGVSINNFDVSGISKSDARYQFENYLENTLPDEIVLKHNDFTTTISLSHIEANFDTKTATNDAFLIGRDNNPLINNFNVLNTLFNKVNINANLNINTEQLHTDLNNISTQLPDAVVQSSYYIENNQLIITSGKDGVVVDVDATTEAIKKSISDFSCSNTPIELIVKSATPDNIDIDKIHSEVYKEPVDAYYTKEPFTIYPSETGLDFNISIDEAKKLITSEIKDEYVIPLKVTYPKITTNMIGTEAFPDLLSTYSTKYSTANVNRTTNLRLAANKINGTVLMPGEIFSYNKVVGQRTISAGYKEAPIYLNGQVVDGLGGGICQITSTLYNAVIYANLEIVQRTNHQFVPSYVTASRDATVVYGSIDFQFKNNRNYPIKLTCSVYNGVASFQIFGLKEDNDYEVSISSYVTGRTSSAIYSEAYKILKKDGKVVSSVLLSKDTYKTH